MTAVEWYSDKLLETLGDNVNLFTKEQTLANHYALEQAKEIEKEQRIDCLKTLLFDISQGKDVENIELYYNETFKND